MKPTIYFDMDGTLVNLYAVDNWLEKLRAYDPSPYMEAAPLIRFCSLAKRLNNLQKQGYDIGVISWLSKEPTPEYDRAVINAKYDYLAEHLPSVKWDRVIIVPHGTPKETFCRTADDVLFDDELKNRENWTGRAFDVSDILGVLREI